MEDTLHLQNCLHTHPLKLQTVSRSMLKLFAYRDGTVTSRACLFPIYELFATQTNGFVYPRRHCINFIGTRLRSH